MASIELFSQRDLKGDSVSVGADNPDFTQIGFNDRTKSMRVTGGEPWVVFEHINYKGDFKLYKPGDYNSLPGFEEKISSVKVVRGGLDGPEIRVYEHINYGGREVILTKNQENLGSHGLNDQISSHKVIGGAWILYEHAQYQGNKMVALAGEEVDNYGHLGWNDKVSSLQLM
uniref:Beta/gamma crystallin 'Greek key' domain-containing protein n=1 Tax=Leptobrachium leishanense TaxID=445787 RepID=A0A8C5MA34_9ANUR